MKKILSLALVMMMVLSTFTMAFAGTFEDVKSDNDNAPAIEALAALNVFNGKPDGTFDPDGIVTRAEMAKLIVVAKNLGNIASGTANYTDVPAEYWASGYISVASQLGVINGRGNGIFDPTATVTYSEAVTMLLRAIGYTNANVNPIGDSYSAVAYLAKANELGLVPSGVRVTDGCTRQDVATMLFDTLKKSVVTTNKDGNAEVVYTSEKDAEGNFIPQTLIATLTTVDSEYIDFDDVKLNQKNNAADLSAYLGQYVTTYRAKKGDKEVIFVSGGKYSTKTTTSVKKVDATHIKIGTTKYEVVANSVEMMVNGARLAKATDANELVDTLKSGYTATISYDKTDNKVYAVTVDKYENARKMSDTDLYAGAKDFTKAYYKLPLTDGKYDASKLIVDGAETLEEIAKDNVIEVAYLNDNAGNSTGTIYKVKVTKDMFQGKVERVNSGTYYYINGKSYTKLDSADLKLGYEGTFYLDRNGKIAFASTTSTINPTTSYYGIMIGSENGTIANGSALSNKLTISKYAKVGIAGFDGTTKAYDLYGKLVLNTAGDTVTDVTVETNAGYDLSNTLVPNFDDCDGGSNIAASGTLVKYTLNSDGQIVKLEEVTLSNATMKDAKSYVDPSKALYTAMFNSNTKILAYDTNDKKFVSYEASKLPTGSSALEATTLNVDGAWAFVVLKETITTSAVKNLALVTKVSDVILDGTIVKEVEAYVDGNKVTYVASKSSIDASVNHIYDIQLDANGRISEVNTVENDPAGTMKTANVTSGASFAVNTNTIKYNTSEYVLIGDQTRVYTFDSYDDYTMSNTGDLARAHALLTGTQNFDVTFYDKDNDGLVDVIIYTKLK